MGIASMTPPPELCSWKAIATYLGVSVRTAQLWERTRGLPVRRLPGPRAQVRAITEELAAWKTAPSAAELGGAAPIADPASDQLPPASAQVPERASQGQRPQRIRLSIAALLTIFAAGAVSVALRPAAVASVRVEPYGLAALDDRGSVVWQRHFGMLNMIQYATGERRTWVGELAGKRVVLFVPAPVGPFQEAVPLLCLDSKGREQWRFVPGKTVTRDATTFAPPYIVRQFAVMGDKIIVTSHHHLYYPSQIAVLNHRGELLREYWHPGHLNVIATGMYHGRPAVFAGGINNLRRAATFLALDPDKLAGAAIEDTRPAFAAMTPGVEEARIIFGQSCLTSPDLYNQVEQIMPGTEGVIVHVKEGYSRAHPPVILYHFTPDLSLSDIVLSDVFAGLHARATHDVAAELERLRHFTSTQ